MLTTVLDLVGLGCAVAAVLVAAAAFLGALGLVIALAGVAIIAVCASWLVDRVRS